MSHTTIAMKVSILFNTPLLKKNEHFSIMETINKNLEELSNHLGNIEVAEIKLYDTMEDNTHNNKALSVSIKLKQGTLEEYRIACNWNEVITDVFHGLMSEAIMSNLEIQLV